jgi:Uma2 family endonuclease
MSSVSIPFSIPEPQPMRRLNVAEYHRMIDAGIVASGEPFELIDGLLVLKDRSKAGEDRMSIGTEHLWAVKNLARLNPKLNRLGCHMQTQGPVVLSEFDEPEPDGAIVRGSEDDYKHAKPAATDVTCIVEVADSSLQYDRTAKLARYANAAIAQYIIINLPDRVVEMYTEPQVGKGRYEESQTLRPGSKVHLSGARGKKLEIATKSLLP